MVAITLNGTPREVPAQHTLHALVESLGLGGQALALAVNRTVVPRQRWSEQVLRAQDQVDVVRAIGGG